MKLVDATTIAAARLAEIERRQAALLDQYPDIYAAAQRFKDEFGPIKVRNVRAAP